jgi:outer membrane protein assembly factor BamB
MLENAPFPAMKLIDGFLYAASGKAITVIDPKQPDERNVVKTFPVEAQIVGALGVSESKDRLYFGTAGGGLVALHAQTGATVWRRNLPREVVAEPIEYQGMVLAACRDGFVYAVRGAELGDPDANLAWKSSPIVDLDHAPVIHEGMGYIGTGSGRVAAIDLSNGRVLWSVGVGSAVTGRLGIFAGRLAVPTLAGGLVSLDRAKGESTWTYRAAGPIRTSPVPGDRCILVGSDDKFVHAVTDSGQLLWKAGASKPVIAPPTLAGTKLYYVSDDQNLYALDLE